MKHRSFLWHAAGFAITTLGGTLLHFLYDWSGQSILLAPFSGVNESTWEHMKLLYWPLLLFSLLQYPFFRESRSFWWVKLWGSLLGLGLIPVLFYTYNGAFGKSPDWLNIAIFYMAAGAFFLLEWRLLRKSSVSCPGQPIAFTILCLLGVLFVLFTFYPPQIPLFADPRTGGYGIGHTKTAMALATAVFTSYQMQGNNLYLTFCLYSA